MRVFEKIATFFSRSLADHEKVIYPRKNVALGLFAFATVIGCSRSVV